VTGPFAIAALVVAVGGAAKLVAPEPTADALAVLGGPHALAVPRAMGAAEVLLGAAAIAYGGRLLAGAVAAAFLAFAAFVLVARRHGGVASCGCFGRTSTPPSLLHVGVNMGCAAVAGLAAAAGVPAVADALDGQPAAGVPFLALVLTGTWLVYAVLTVVPEVLAATRPAEPAVSTFRLLDPVPVATPVRRPGPR
jgi:hypothetical protein